MLKRFLLTACLAGVSSLSMALASKGEEIDVFLRAVGFALTGSDNATPTIIDRANCVFRIGNDTFFLNNVHVDRITLQQFRNAFEIWTQVTIHGDKTVIKKDEEGLKDDGSEFKRAWKISHPEDFLPHSYKYNETDIRLNTTDQSRVNRAWVYIYSHGCTGTKSPF